MRRLVAPLTIAVLVLAPAGCAQTVDLAPPPPATEVPDLRGTWTGTWGGAPVRLVVSEQKELGDYSGVSVGPVQVLGRRLPGVSGVITSTIAGAPVTARVDGWLGYRGGRLTLLLNATTPDGRQQLVLARAADDRWAGHGESDFAWGPQGPVELRRQTAPVGRPLNPRLASLPAGTWIEIHRQQPTDPVRFRRQAHGGSAFDTRRGRIVLFGSDTHGEDWTNSPLFFDLASLTWARAYPDDPPSTYRITSEGLPVAGIDGSRPWAMHTFAAVTYDALNDRLVVASLPAHLEPGRFTDAMAHLWPKIRRHPTWLFELGPRRWRPLGPPDVDFFPYATAYDSHRAVVVGHRPEGVYELAMRERDPVWRRVASASPTGYHTNAVYDSRRRLVVVAGGNRLSNAIVVYDPETSHDRQMPTPGARPPAFEHAPMAFHERKGVTVVLVDRPAEEAPPGGPRPGRAETWLYDATADAWSRAPHAGLPFRSGMNYNLHYDALHDLLLLVAEEPGGPAAVWASRLP
ncbi:MAG: hypothetical protein ACREM3_17055 [Candidatus Rokuibacteriota bacterium]